MGIEEIKYDNEKYYYSGDYIWFFRRFYGRTVTVLLAVMTWICVKAGKLLMKRKLLLEAATATLDQDGKAHGLGYMDVMEWVQGRMYANRWDGVTTVIVVLNVFLLLYFTLYVGRKVKSYDLYKKRSCRIVPILLFSIELGYVMTAYADLFWFPAMLAVIFELAPAILTSRLFVPLESRPKPKGELDLTWIFEFISKIIIKHL